MALYTVGLVACLLWHAPANHSEWKAIFAAPLVRIPTMLFVGALLYHAWVGMRDILMDYVKPTGARLGLEMLVGLVLLCYLIWSASILWGR